MLVKLRERKRENLPGQCNDTQADPDCKGDNMSEGRDGVAAIEGERQEVGGEAEVADGKGQVHLGLVL